MTETDWKKAYWDIIYCRSYAPAEIYPLLQQIDQLTSKNELQAGKIMEQEFLLSCIRFTGDTVIVDAKTMLRMKRFIKQSLEPETDGSITQGRYSCPK